MYPFDSFYLWNSNIAPERSKAVKTKENKRGKSSGSGI
jgi:hypothetical protein